MSELQQLSLKESTLKYIELLNFKELTPIQKESIPPVRNGRDLIGLADTGTGKTHAYLIPILDKVRSDVNKVQAVIIVPTRELARQIYETARIYNQVDPDLRIRLLSSEISREKMEDSLKNEPHIVIGTPGRLKDAFLDSALVRLDSADILVIDEADMTAEYGFINDLDAIAGHMKEHLQMLAFSATMPQQLRIFLEKYMHDPVQVTIKDHSDYFANVKHYLIPAKHQTYTHTLLRILPGFKPYICLIFANSREEASEAAEAMRNEGYKVVEIHGGLQQRERKNAMKQIASLEAQYIVATDIAARGIDVPGVSHVISLGFPKAIEYYVHRAGRTGRIRHEGVCYAIYKPEDDEAIRTLTKQGIKFGHTDYRGGSWHELKPYGYVRKKPVTELDKQIKRIADRPVKKVKPGYKKKKAEEIEKLRRKHKRAMIQENIRKISKEKNRQKQREKNIESGKYD